MPLSPAPACLNVGNMPDTLADINRDSDGSDSGRLAVLQTNRNRWAPPVVPEEILAMPPVFCCDSRHGRAMNKVTIDDLTPS